MQGSLNAFLACLHSAAEALLAGRRGCSSGGSGSTGDSGGGGGHGDGSSNGMSDETSSGGSSSLGELQAQLALDASMTDWVDGRLLHCIVAGLLAGREPQLAPAEEAELQQLAGLVAAGARAAAATAGGGATRPEAPEAPVAGGQAALPSSPAPLESTVQLDPVGSWSSCCGDEGDESNDAVAARPSPVRLLPVAGNALVEAVEADSGGSMLQCFGLDSPEVARAREALQRPYAADYHWHTGGACEESYSCEHQESGSHPHVQGPSPGLPARLPSPSAAFGSTRPCSCRCHAPRRQACLPPPALGMTCLLDLQIESPTD